MTFVVEALGATPDPWQAEALQSLSLEDRVSIKSGHGVGKSVLDSWAILWFISTRYPCKIPVSAPTLHQIKDVLWSELAIWHKRLIPYLREKFDMKASDQDMRFFLKDNPEASFATARTGRKDNPEALQGFHSDNLLYVLDEASGIDPIVTETAMGALSTKGAKVLMTSNPTRVTGYFWDSWNKLRDRFHRITVSCLDSERVAEEYIDDVAVTYGIDSDVYRVRVLGEFPSASSTQFISLSDVENCLAYRAAGYERLPMLLGVDVARFGDDRTVILPRQGRKVFKPLVFRGLDTMQVAARTIEAINEYDAKLAFIDDIGVGAGVTDRLKQLGYTWKVRPVNVGSKADDEVVYFNRRSEAWGRMRDAIHGGLELPDEPDLVSDLTGPEYSFTPRQQIKLERKEDMKKRGLASPDMGDALALTYAEQVLMSHRRERPVPQVTIC